MKNPIKDIILKIKNKKKTFKIEKNKADDEQKKNKNLSSNKYRIRIWGKMNETPIEKKNFTADLQLDTNDNYIMLNENEGFTEELPGVSHLLISDLLCKLELRELSKDQKLNVINKKIKEQEKILSKENNGKIKTKDGETININFHTEKGRLILFRCVKYVLENKNSGSFERIESDGMRTLEYQIIDQQIYPLWWNNPVSNNEPIVISPDISQVKKIYDDNKFEAYQDFLESKDDNWLSGIFGIITKVSFVLLFIGLIVWTTYLISWNKELSSQTCESQIKNLEITNQQTAQKCTDILRIQGENDKVFIDWAKYKLKQSMLEENKTEDKSNKNI